MRGISTTAWKATIAMVGIAVASVAFVSPALATAPAPAPVSGEPAGSTWTAFPEGRLLVDNGRDLSQVAGGRLRTLVAGSTFQRKYGSFAKNGTTIVYSDVGRRGFGAQLWVMDARGGGRRQITALSAEAFGAKFSPDGSKIAFQTAAGGTSAIWLVDADGAHPHQISKPGSRYYGPGLSWAPNSQLLVATRAQLDPNSGEPYDWQLVTIRADGTKETALTSAGGDKNSPVWSPSGRTIVFSYITPAGMQAGTQYDLYSMNANGTGLRRLTNTPNVGEQDAVFSPSSDALAYASWRSEETTPTVMKAKADGTVTQAVNAIGYPTGWES